MVCRPVTSTNVRVISVLQKGLLPTIYPGFRLCHSLEALSACLASKCSTLFISTSELTPALQLYQLNAF